MVCMYVCMYISSIMLPQMCMYVCILALLLSHITQLIVCHQACSFTLNTHSSLLVIKYIQTFMVYIKAQIKLTNNLIYKDNSIAELNCWSYNKQTHIYMCISIVRMFVFQFNRMFNITCYFNTKIQNGSLITLALLKKKFSNLSQFEFTSDYRSKKNNERSGGI